MYTLHAHGVRQQAARGGRVRRLPSMFGKCIMSIMIVCFLTCQPYVIALEGDGWQVKKQTAQAVPAAVPVALEFLEALAAAAGMSVSDFVVTYGIAIAGLTGYNLYTGSSLYGSVVLGANDTVKALNSITATAEYPDYASLSQADQEAWVNETNYKAAQFNQLLQGKLAEDRDSYYGTGGGTFDGESQSLLDRWSDIYSTWADGGKVAIPDVKTLIPDISTTDYQKQLMNVKLATKDENTDVEWPASIPSTLPINTGFVFSVNQGNDVFVSSGCIHTIWFANTSSYLKSAMFSKNDFTVSRNGGTWPGQAKRKEINGKVFYAEYPSRSNRYNWINGANVSFLDYLNFDTTAMDNVVYNLLYVNDIDGMMIDYPGDLPQNLDFPSTGIGSTGLGPNTTWPSLFGEPGSGGNTAAYPESDFNPNADGDGGYIPETATPEWQQQTQDQIFTPALNLPFDEMFPFCVIWDISKLMNKLYELGGYQAVSADQSTSLRGLYDKREGLQVQADEASRGGAQLNAWSKPGWTAGHTEFMLPLADFGIYGMYDLELDVWPLAVLLAWLKPFFQLAFIAGLLYVTIVTFRMFIFTD